MIEIRELGLFGGWGYDSFFRMGLVVEFEGVVGLNKVLLGLLYLRVYCNPVKSLVRSRLYFESLIMAHFFFLGGCVTSAERPRKIITANKSRGTTNIAILAMTIIIFRSFSNSVISDAVGEDIFVLEVLFERNASRHDGEELRITAWVRGKVLFRQFFFAIQPMPAAKTVRVPAFTIVLTSLLSKMV